MLGTTTMSEATVGVPVQVGLSERGRKCLAQPDPTGLRTAGPSGSGAAVTGIEVEDISQEPGSHHSSCIGCRADFARSSAAGI